MSELEPIVVEAEVETKVEAGGRIDKDGNLNGNLKVHGALSVDKGAVLKGETEEHAPLEVHLDVTETGDFKVGDENGDPVKITNIEEPEADTDAATKLYVDNGHRRRFVFCTAEIPAAGETIRIARGSFFPTVEVNECVIGRNGRFGRVTEITREGLLHIEKATVTGLGDALEAARWDVSSEFAEAKQFDPELTPEDYLAGLSAGRYVLADPEHSVNYADNVDFGGVVISSIRAFSDESIHNIIVFVGGTAVFVAEFSAEGAAIAGPITVQTPTENGHAVNKEYADLHSFGYVFEDIPGVGEHVTVSRFQCMPANIYPGKWMIGKNGRFGTISSIGTETVTIEGSNHDILGGTVAANQGTENAGKFLVIDSDGFVQPTAMSAWQGGNYGT